MNEHTRRHIQVGLRYSSGLPGVPKGDMFVAVMSKSAWHAVGAQLASLLTFVNKTYSETGQVKLASRDPSAEPICAPTACHADLLITATNMSPFGTPGKPDE